MLVRANSVVAMVVLTWTSVAPSVGFLQMPKTWTDLRPVLEDTSLSAAAKVEKIDAYFGEKRGSLEAIQFIGQVDPVEAGRRYRKAFSDPATSVKDKLQIGRYLLQQPELKQGDFIDEYSGWLVKQIIADRKTMMKAVGEHETTPIGVYGFMASGFEGYTDPTWFEKVKDDRIVPILIEALTMPDWVHSNDHRGCVRVPAEMVGQPTGRNVDRQQLPSALARHGATEAIPALKRVLADHHDWYLRDNAAYALAVLVKPTDRRSLIELMESQRMVTEMADPDGWRKDRFFHLFAFGRGLLARGDDAGVPLMALKYSNYDVMDKQRHPTDYVLGERLSVLKDVRSDKLADLIRGWLADERVMAMFVTGTTPSGTIEQRVAETHDLLCDLLEANRLQLLRPSLESLAVKSKSQVIRDRTGACLEALVKPQDASAR